MTDSPTNIPVKKSGSPDFYMLGYGAGSAGDPSKAAVVLCGLCAGVVTPLKCDASGRLVVIISEEEEA